MSVVRDPAFWRRFSTAVHLDEEAQAEAEKKTNLKHSYVDTRPLCVEPFEETRDPVAGEHPPSGLNDELEAIGPPASAPPGYMPSEDEKQAMSFAQSLDAPAHSQSRSTSPFPQCPPFSSHSPQRYSPSPAPSIHIPQPTRLRSQSSSYPLISPVALSRNLNRKSNATIYSNHSLPLGTPPVDRSPSPSYSEQFPFPEQPSADEHAYPSPIPPSSHPAVTSRPRPEPEKAPQVLYTRRNTSTLTLGLSGRPRSRGFQFWTSVTADPSNRESWLEEQQRKKSKRTCMCWGFWLAIIAVVAGVVVAVLLLKGKGIL